MPSRQITVSFIVPCYNYAHFLGECVASLLRQSYTDFEILVMDDASSDNTPEVAKSISDSRVVHVRNERNLGLNANINKGLALARGEYVWLISADDKLRNDSALEKYVRFIEEHPTAAFVFSPTVAIRDGKENPAPIFCTVYGEADRLLKAPEMGFIAVQGCPLRGPAMMVKKSLIEEVGGYRPELPRAADWYLIGAIGMAHDVGYLAEPAANFRFHKSSLDHQWLSQDLDFAREQDVAALQLLSRRAETLGLWTLAWAYQAEIPRLFIRLGRQAYNRGFHSHAKRNFELALNCGSQTRRAYTGLFWISLGRFGHYLRSPGKMIRSLFSGSRKNSISF